MGYNRAKRKMKKLFFVIAIVMVFATNAHAQIFEFLRQAVDATNEVMETYDRVDNTVSNIRDRYESSHAKPEDSYTKVSRVTMFRKTGVGKTWDHVDVYETPDGYYKVYKNGSYYSVYENSNYDSYSYDTDDYSYYKYYVNCGNTYYFNM